MKLFTLLCCINPASSIDNINEFTFYQMINPVAPVVNIKLFHNDAQVKAFVQVKTLEQVEKVIKELYNKHLNVGKIKVFLSYKKYIAFEKSLAQIVESVNRYSFSKGKGKDIEKGKGKLVANPYLCNSGHGFMYKGDSHIHMRPVDPTGTLTRLKMFMSKTRIIIIETHLVTTLNLK